MSLFCYDFYKVYFQKSVHIIFLVCIALNLFLIHYQEAESNFFYSPSAYRAVFDDLAGKSNHEAYDLLKAKKEKLDEINNPLYEQSDAYTYELEYTADRWREQRLIDDCIAEITQVVAYAEYIDEIQENADSMSIVSIFERKSTFSSRNITKTAQEFESLRNIPVDCDISRGVIMATGFAGTDFFSLIMLFIVVFNLVLTEREQGLLALIGPTANGKTHTAVSKVKVLLVSCLLIFLTLYLTNFASAIFTYGFGNLSRPIQSVFGYNSCSLKISVWQYLALFSIAKLAILILLALFMHCMCLVWGNSIVIYISIVGTYLVSMLLYVSIPMNSPLSALKYINIYYFQQTDQILTRYLNVNVFNQPIHIVSVFFTVVCILTMLLFYLIIRMMNGYHVFLIKKTHFDSLLSKISYRRNPRIKGLLYYEFLKGLWHNKSIVVLVVFVLFQLYTYHNYSLHLQPEDIYYKNYMDYLNGAITPEKEEYIQRETERINDLYLSETVMEGSHKALRDGWHKVLSRYEQIITMKEYADIDLWFVYETGYQQLTGDNENMDLIAMLKMIIILTICLPSIFTHEYSTGMNIILFTTQNGREKTLRAKLVVSASLLLFVFIVSYGFDFMSVFHKVGMVGFDAPLQSLDTFAFFPFSSTITQYMILLYALRLFGMSLVALVISAVSVLSGNTIKTMILSTGMFSLPGILSLLGISFTNYISLTPVLSGNMFLRYVTLEGKGVGLLVIYLIITFLLCVKAKTGPNNRL